MSARGRVGGVGCIAVQWEAGGMCVCVCVWFDCEGMWCTAGVV